MVREERQGDRGIEGGRERGREREKGEREIFAECTYLTYLRHGEAAPIAFCAAQAQVCRERAYV